MDDRLIAAGRPFNYRTRDAATLLDAMKAVASQTLPQWTSHESEADFGRAMLELVAHMGDIISYYTDAVANESFLGTAQSRRSVIEHLKLIGYRLSTAAPALADLTLMVSKRPPDTTKVAVNPGDAFTASGPDGPIRFEYLGTSPLELTFAKEKAGEFFPTTKTIPVVEGRTVSDYLGQSDGTPYQRFPLTHPGLILRSLAEHEVELTVEGEPPPTKWRLRESLAFSGPSDLDFTVEVDDVDRAVLVFGTKWPEAGKGLTARYRVGGGVHGNVAIDAIRTIAHAPQLIALEGNPFVTNAAPAVAGAERESIEHAVAVAPSVFRSLNRAVTVNDFVTLALAFPGVGKARARATTWKNLVELLIAPQAGGPVSDGMKSDLLKYFEDKRPIGTRIEIKSFTYVPIFVEVVLDVAPYFSADTVAEQVRAAVRGVLAFDRVGLGEVVYLSKFFEAIEAIDGVAGVNITEFSRPKQEMRVPPDGKLVMKPNELPRAADAGDLTRHPHPVTTVGDGAIRVITDGGAA